MINPLAPISIFHINSLAQWLMWHIGPAWPTGPSTWPRQHDTHNPCLTQAWPSFDQIWPGFDPFGPNQSTAELKTCMSATSCPTITVLNSLLHNFNLQITLVHHFSLHNFTTCHISTLVTIFQPWYLFSLLYHFCCSKLSHITYQISHWEGGTWHSHTYLSIHI